MYFTYILESKKNNRYYYGSTQNIYKRLKEHNSGSAKSTKNLRPLELIYFEEFETLSEARQREARFKKLKNKKYIKWLINNNLDV